MNIDLPSDPGDAFLVLSLAIDAHFPGHIDSCYLKEEDRARWAIERIPLTDIVSACYALETDLTNRVGPDAERYAYLVDQLGAMRRKVEFSTEGKSTVANEARAFLGIEPEWIDDAIFDREQDRLRGLLPLNGGSLHERENAFRRNGQVKLTPTSPTVYAIMDWLQSRVRKLLTLPVGERADIFLNDALLSMAYHRYQGNMISTMEINPMRVMDIAGLISLIAHEVYPGHHTELVIKECTLNRRRGWREHQVTIIDAPSCVIAEGIATRGLYVIITQDELIERCGELLTLSGLDRGDAETRVQVEKSRQILRNIVNNAALLLDDPTVSERDILYYITEKGLTDDREAQRMLRFARTVRSYALTYSQGSKLVDQFLDRVDDKPSALAKLLREPVTPTILKAWYANAA
ncbi:hypothetical protein FS815_27380 [Agrobacterium vitis]|uniref:hypothetical protein n=1 Tax=Allorhizobium ampelinum TaxID=3025782 RepID=UPI001F176EDB|nr:hypothetical protein [Allorhizobium ampelinum]MCF1450501.1 hypothetical protein [Allorhizobium ampelinum]